MVDTSMVTWVYKPIIFGAVGGGPTIICKCHAMGHSESHLAGAKELRQGLAAAYCILFGSLEETCWTTCHAKKYSRAMSIIYMSQMVM
jgi:hypothetical protein